MSSATAKPLVSIHIKSANRTLLKPARNRFVKISQDPEMNSYIGNAEAFKLRLHDFCSNGGRSLQWKFLLQNTALSVFLLKKTN